MRDTPVADPGRNPAERRSDPLIPILGSAVTLVCLGAVLLVFYPRLRSILADDRGAVVRSVAPAEGKIPLWVCRTEEGVALLLEPLELSGDTKDKALDSILAGGTHHYLRLRVYNFGRDEDYVLALPAQGFDSPEGGPRLVPCASMLPKDIASASLKLMRGLGAVATLTVAPGHHARALFATSGNDLSQRTAFLSGGLTFERREVARGTLAQWHQTPALRQFLDF